MVSAQSVIVFILMILIGVGAPAALAVWWVRKTKQPITVILTGAMIFFVFALVLETLPKLILFQTNNPVGRFVMSHEWLFMGSAALLAGLFEETGRLIAFRFILKKRTERRTALTYGIGHGGFEVLYLLTMGGVENLVLAILVNLGQFDSMVAEAAAAAPEQAETLAALPEALAAVTFVTLLYSAIERVSAVLIHLSCSILVFTAVREKGKRWMFPAAILLHASVDLFAALYQVGIIQNLAVLEGGLLVWAVLFFAVTMKTVYGKLPDAEE